jgi:protein ImuA
LPSPGRADRRQALDHLRRQVAALEHAPACTLPPVSLGAPIDAALPWRGLPRGALHEVTGGAAGFGFITAVLAAALAKGGQVLWCQTALAAGEAGELYGAGLLGHGLAPERLTIARCRSRQDMLWAMEEGLRSCAVAVVVGEAAAIGLTASRRLQLAAEAGGALGFLLDRLPRTASDAGRAASSAALTRWRLAPAAGSRSFERRRWRVALDYCRGGPARAWLMEWRPSGARAHHEDSTERQPDPSGLVVVAELRDRPARDRAVA